EYAAFLANSLVFLLLGEELRQTNFAGLALPVAVAVVATLGVRALVVHGFAAILSFRRPILPAGWRNLLVWGGLRGALPVAPAATARPRPSEPLACATAPARSGPTAAPALVRVVTNPIATGTSWGAMPGYS